LLGRGLGISAREGVGHLPGLGAEMPFPQRGDDRRHLAGSEGRLVHADGGRGGENPRTAAERRVHYWDAALLP
jgi:hypothetical protein